MDPSMEFDLDQIFPEELIIPDELANDAEAAKNACLPEKSKKRYYKALSCFENWCTTNNVVAITEDILMAYFYQLSKKFKPSSLWAYYSMLKGTLKVKMGVDISSYNQLSAFLKQNGKGHKPKTSKVFTEEEMKRFIVEACDEAWLDVKVSYFHYSQCFSSC